ncbi:MAG: hypothetical protein L0G63_12505, partial [Psychrobacter sp.]|uniref:hypothetical protein n=1 Tax=Psychrobacter sp. TaxID=56811 RepID=UPI0026480676
NNFSDQQCLFANVQHALIIICWLISIYEWALTEVFVIVEPDVCCFVVLGGPGSKNARAE